MQYIGNLGMGGAENHVLTLCEHVDRQRIKPMITCVTHDRAEIVQRAARLDVPVYGFPTPGRDLRSYLKRTLALAKLLRREQVDVLHIHATGYTGLNALIAALTARIPVIVITHHAWYGPRPHNRGGYVTRWLEKRFATRVIMLYSGAARELASVGIPSQRIAVVPMGVDLQRFRPAEHTNGLAPSPTRLIMVARMFWGKGHEPLLEAVARLAGRYPRLRLLLVGDGPLRSAIEAQIAELGLGDVVEVAGHVPNEQIPAVLRTAQVTVLPSYMPGEAFPNTLLEGMATGLAAVGTRWVGIPDIIADGETGLIVEPRNVDDLAAAIERLVADPALAAEMGRKARCRAEQLFSAERIVHSISDIYLQAASEQGLPPAIASGIVT
jgi:glycosyltransferase involved in cell wall biosynthesis